MQKSKFIFIGDSVEHVNTIEDFSEHIRELFSYQASQVFNEMVESEINVARNIAEKALETDLRSYEMQLEDYSYAARDTLDGLETLKEVITTSKRLNRQEMLTMIRNIEREIHNVY